MSNHRPIPGVSYYWPTPTGVVAVVCVEHGTGGRNFVRGKSQDAHCVVTSASEGTFVLPDDCMFSDPVAAAIESVMMLKECYGVGHSPTKDGTRG